ncbi:MAG: hypothetical protein EON58_19615 [Alphaproteobacteria bacterium]|nr:MAG: hypothetical protein EON58_19615 [Alphaproteobacteria bacterium]
MSACRHKDRGYRFEWRVGFSPSTIRVPLAREFRTKRYLADEASKARIAVRLGITEGGVDKIVAQLSASVELDPIAPE